MLTLRGRHLHTLRWMLHSNRTAFPYHVIIADWDVHPTIARLLSDSATFPNLSYEYHQYCDTSYSDFYSKLNDAIGMVKTRFVMLTDNDDFIIKTGITNSISFLDNNPEYVCAGGKIPNFTIIPSPEFPDLTIGEIVRIQFGYKNQTRGIEFPTASVRVMDEIERYQPISYHIHRTKTLQTVFEEFVGHNFSDLSVAEFYHALRIVTLGKVHTNPAAVCYFRQNGTSTNAMVTHDWVYNLLRGNLPQDFRAMASTIATEAMRIDEKNSSGLRDTILDAYANYIRHLLGATMMRHRFPRLFQLKQKLLLLKGLELTPRWYKRRLLESKFLRGLSNDFLDKSLLKAYRSDFNQVETTLRGDEFLSFLQANAPDLLKAA